MLRSLRLPASLLTTDGDNEESETTNISLEDHDEVHVEVSNNKDDDFSGSAEEIAGRFTAKELKDMCRKKDIPMHGDKKALAKRLLEERVVMDEEN